MMQTQKKLTIAAALAATVLVSNVSTPQASAGPIIDWLLNRNRTPAYVANYPLANPPYLTGYPVAAGYPAYSPYPAQAPLAAAPTVPLTTPLTSLPTYNTSLNTVPTTYYRPVTTTDPITGQTATSLQACTSYQQQVLRTPTLLPGSVATPVYAPPAAPLAAAAPNPTYYAAYGTYGMGLAQNRYSSVTGSTIATSPGQSGLSIPSTIGAIGSTEAVALPPVSAPPSVYTGYQTFPVTANYGPPPTNYLPTMPAQQPFGTTVQPLGSALQPLSSVVPASTAPAYTSNYPNYASTGGTVNADGSIITPLGPPTISAPIDNSAPPATYSQPATSPYPSYSSNYPQSSSGYPPTTTAAPLNAAPLTAAPPNTAPQSAYPASTYPPTTSSYLPESTAPVCPPGTVPASSYPASSYPADPNSSSAGGYTGATPYPGTTDPVLPPTASSPQTQPQSLPPTSAPLQMDPEATVQPVLPYQSQNASPVDTSGMVAIDGLSSRLVNIDRPATDASAVQFGRRPLGSAVAETSTASRVDEPLQPPPLLPASQWRSNAIAAPADYDPQPYWRSDRSQSSSLDLQAAGQPQRSQPAPEFRPARQLTPASPPSNADLGEDAVRWISETKPLPPAAASRTTTPSTTLPAMLPGQQPARLAPADDGFRAVRP